MGYGSNTDDDSRFGMEFETGSQAQSTLVDAFYCPAKVTNIACPVILAMNQASQ